MSLLIELLFLVPLLLGGARGGHRTPRKQIVSLRHNEANSLDAHVGRIIVTQDRDFLIIANSGEIHRGIAYCQKDKLSIGEIIESLVLIYEVLTSEELAGKVEFL